MAPLGRLCLQCTTSSSWIKTNARAAAEKYASAKKEFVASGITCVPAIFFGNFGLTGGFNRPGQHKAHHGKKTYRYSIGGVRIRVWNCSTRELWHRYD